MNRSGALRVDDLRAAYRLIGDCRDLGSDPDLWCPRMLDGVCRIFGVPQATGGEARWFRPGGGIEAVSAYAASDDPAAHSHFHAYHRAKGPATDPLYRALGKLTDPRVTLRRRQLVPDDAWYRSASFDEFRRPAGIDHELVSVSQRSDDGSSSIIALNRLIGERDYSPREQNLFDFFHAELGRLIGGPLVSATEASVGSLSPRVRQTLACLLEGNSEKQVASRLGLSLPTIHQYVTKLYRHFGVRSRAQLLAHALRRAGQESWRRLTPGE